MKSIILVLCLLITIIISGCNDAILTENPVVEKVELNNDSNNNLFEYKVTLQIPSGYGEISPRVILFSNFPYKAGDTIYTMPKNY